MKKSGLGKGLGAMIPKNTITNFEVTSVNDTFTWIDHDKIEPNPNQPRKNFSKHELNELAESIQEHGIIQPLVVNAVADFSDRDDPKQRYVIIAGERRWRASRIAGLTTLPCIIKTYDDMKALQISLIENIQRQDLNPIEEAACYKQLEEYFFHKKEDIAKKVGKSRNTISARLSLLTLCDFVVDLLMKEEISASHGQKLVGLSPARQEEIARIIMEKGLSVKDTEKIANAMPTSAPENKKPTIYNPYVGIESGLKELLGTKVAIKDKNGKGKIEIEYYSNEDLERIIDLLK